MLNKLNNAFPLLPDGSRQIYTRKFTRSAVYDEVLLNIGTESTFALGRLLITRETTKPQGYNLDETLTVRLVTQQKSSS